MVFHSITLYFQPPVVREAPPPPAPQTVVEVREELGPKYIVSVVKEVSSYNLVERRISDLMMYFGRGDHEGDVHIKFPRLFAKPPILSVLDFSALLDSAHVDQLEEFLLQHDQRDRSILELVSRKFIPKYSVRVDCLSNFIKNSAVSKTVFQYLD